MLIQKFEVSQKLSTAETTKLLYLFNQAAIETDYMATGEITDEEMLRKVLHNKNFLHFFGYEDQTPVAYCQVIYKSTSTNFSSGAKINALAVLPEKRGRGLGKQLLTEVVANLKINFSIKNIYLEVVKNNIVAIELYQHSGFAKTGELKSIFTKDDTLLDVEIYSLLVNKE